MNTRKSRTVSNVVSATQTHEGAGFLVNRPFPTSRLTDYDPFPLLDEMGPADLAPNEAREHPIIHIAASRPSPTWSAAGCSIETPRAMPEHSSPESAVDDGR
jgi:hypothetical protein